MTWTTIFRDAVNAVAGVTVYDKGQTNILGRYVVAKMMRLANGQTRWTQTNYSQKPAALAYAKKFLQERASKAGKQYQPGDGVNTLGFKPVLLAQEVAS